MRAQHRRLLLWDCYRPRSIQYALWRRVPDERYVANPAQGHRDHALSGDRGLEARRLQDAMQAAGFIGLPTEWWHFDAADWESYPLSDEPL